MKRACLTRWLLSGLIVAGAFGRPAAARASRASAQPEPAAGLRILESNATEMRIELTVGAFVTETVSIDGSAYQRLIGYPTRHRDLMIAFYQAIFTNHLYALGAAATAAKVDVLGQNSGLAGLAQTYILFGDPATTLGRTAVSRPKINLPPIWRGHHAG